MFNKRRLWMTILSAWLTFALLTGILLASSTRPCERGARARICRTPTAIPTQPPHPTTTPVPGAAVFTLSDCAGGVIQEPTHSVRGRITVYAEFTLTLVRPGGLLADTVYYETLNSGSASAGLDFEAIPRSPAVLWSGSPTFIVRVPVYSDGERESAETVALRATWRDYLALYSDDASCTILDAD